MAVSKAQIKATTKYNSKMYDEVKIRVPKGKREKIKWEIYQLGHDSINQFIFEAILEKIEKEKNAKNE